MFNEALVTVYLSAMNYLQHSRYLCRFVRSDSNLRRALGVPCREDEQDGPPDRALFCFGQSEIKNEEDQQLVAAWSDKIL